MSGGQLGEGDLIVKRFLNRAPTWNVSAPAFGSSNGRAGLWRT